MRGSQSREKSIARACILECSKEAHMEERGGRKQERSDGEELDMTGI